MKFDIHPLKGLNELQFGMEPEIARSTLPGEFKSFKRTPKSVFPSDFFEDLGVFIYYKLPGYVEAMELSEPAQALFSGVNLLSVSYSDCRKIFLGVDAKTLPAEDSVTSYELGISVYYPDGEESESAESVLVFEKGYFD
jgi:hypothetical protein